MALKKDGRNWGSKGSINKDPKITTTSNIPKGKTTQFKQRKDQPRK